MAELRAIDLKRTGTFRVCSALSAGVLGLLGLAAIGVGAHVGRAHPVLLAGGIAAAVSVWAAAVVVYRVGRRDAVVVTITADALTIDGVMLRQPLRLSRAEIEMTAIDEAKVRVDAPRARRFQVEQAYGSPDWLYRAGSRSRSLPKLNVESFTPNVAVVLKEPVPLPVMRPLYRFFLGRYPFHRTPTRLRGFCFAARDLDAARAALGPLGLTRDPRPGDLKLLDVTPHEQRRVALRWRLAMASVSLSVAAGTLTSIT